MKLIANCSTYVYVFILPNLRSFSSHLVQLANSILE